MPYEDDDAKTDEFVNVLLIVEDIIAYKLDSHIVLGGDCNVDLSKVSIEQFL